MNAAHGITDSIGKSILAALTCLQQGSADLTVEANLVADRFARFLELLLMLVLGAVEEPTDDLVMQVDDLVDDRGGRFGHQGYQSRIPTLRLELRQVGRRHLSAFTRNLEQPILVDLTLDAKGQIERL